MKVFITGASGFVGAHTARNLLDAGHDVRLLVRNPDGVREYFARHGHAVDDLVVADMRDAAAVKAGMRGCDAVVHAAAIVSVDPRRADALYRNNVAGIDAVLGSAGELGIRRIVHVSSLSVLFQPGIQTLSESVPLANPTQAYARSKRDCDEHVRRLQEQGLPVQITYPSGVIGPDDPKLSETNRGVIAFLRVVPDTATGIQCVDVRDLAFVHRRLLENEAPDKPKDRRFIVAGVYYGWRDLNALLRRLTGRYIPAPWSPGFVMRGLGSAIDLVRRLAPFETQLSREAMGYVTQWVFASSAPAVAASGVQFRPGDETFSDTIRWLAAAGHMPPRLAGRLLQT